MKVLFFSRGRGRGHAIPDVAIANELLEAEPDLSIRFVSYAMGAETIRQMGHDVIDMNLPEANPFLQTLIQSVAIINEEEPSLIVAHEEFCVPSASTLLGIPCVFLTDWFPPEQSIWMDSLLYAARVIVMDDPGYRDEPPGLQGRIEYVGPTIREMNATKADRHAERNRLGFPQDARILLVLPGGSSDSSEEKAPLFRLVGEALEVLGTIGLTVWVVSAAEEAKMRSVAPVQPNTIFLRPHVNIDRTMVAADIAITKGTRITGFELNALGIPSVSISYGLNPVDDSRVPQIRTNRSLRGRGLSGTSLAYHLREMLAEEPSAAAVSDDWSRGRRGVIAEIRHQLKSCGAGHNAI